MKIFRKIFLWGFVGLLSLGQLQRVELTNQFSGINIYFHEILLLLWIFHVVFTNFTLFTKYIFNFFKQNRLEKYFLFIILISLSINLLQNNDYLSLLYMGRLVLYFLTGFSFSFLIKNKKINSDYFRFQLFSVGLLSLFLGFLQYTFIKDTRFLSVLGWDDHFARLISTYFDPGFTGIIFLITLLIGLSSKYIKQKFIKLIIVLLFSWGIILTFSRATYLALLASLSVLSTPQILKNKTNFKNILFGLIIFGLLIFLAPKPYGEGVDLFRKSTIFARTNAITQQIKSITFKTLLIGNGPFSYKNSLNVESQNNILPSHSRVPDNIFMNILLSTGVIGLIIFTLLLFKWLKYLKNSDYYLFAGFVGLLIHTQFSNSLLQPFVLILILASVASIKKTNIKD